jgi:glycosyltransferase involved in cell wall biosynthesis
MTLSLIISTLNEGIELHETLESAVAGSLVPDEIIVVNDGGTDDSCTLLDSQFRRERHVSIHHTPRRGIAAARNIGAALAMGDNLVFVDAHCRLENACLAVLDEALTTQPNAIFAPAMRDMGASTYGCGARLIDPALRIKWLVLEHTPFTVVPIAPGGCIALKKVTFDWLGGFGAFRELGLEDIEFSLRAWRVGVDLLAVPDARLTHRFRQYPPYPLSSTSRGYNLALVALIHFDGARRADCLRSLVGTMRGCEVLVDAIASDWQEQKQALDARSVRSADAYFDRFGDWK